MKKIKILRIIGTLDPEYGGPAKAIIDHSIALSKEGFDVTILTSDNKKNKYYKGNEITIKNIGPALGNYKFNLNLYFWLNKNKSKYNFFFIHGLWQFNTLVARLLLKKNYYVFSHGQLDPFFKTQIFKCLKKKIYWFLIEKKNLINSKSLLLTSDDEKKLLNNTFVNTSGIRKKVIEYGIIKPRLKYSKSVDYFKSKFTKLKKNNYFIYLGRFHEKKGCDIILHTIKKLKDTGIKINVLMAGPNSEYKKKLIKLSIKLKIEKNIFWSGTVIGDIKLLAIKNSIAMILPSHGENFGVSLVESLSLKRPVITTNKVNIHKTINLNNAGIITKDTLNSFFKGIKYFVNLNQKERLKLNKNAYLCFDNNFNLLKNIGNIKKIIK